MYILMITLVKKKNPCIMYLTSLHIYSALRKYSYPFIYSMFYVAALLNCFKLFFLSPTSVYTQYTIMTKQKQNWHNFVNLLK